MKFQFANIFANKEKATIDITHDGKVISFTVGSVISSRSKD